MSVGFAHEVPIWQSKLGSRATENAESKRDGIVAHGWRGCVRQRISIADAAPDRSGKRRTTMNRFYASARGMKDEGGITGTRCWAKH